MEEPSVQPEAIHSALPTSTATKPYRTRAVPGYDRHAAPPAAAGPGDRAPSVATR
jgi:hypothetical protein